MEDVKNHAEMVWDELQKAKAEIERQDNVIDMLKQSRINYEFGDDSKNTTKLRIVDRILSDDYADHAHQAIGEAGALYTCTKDSSIEYHGLQSIAQSNISIVMLLEKIYIQLVNKEE